MNYNEQRRDFNFDSHESKHVLKAQDLVFNERRKQFIKWGSQSHKADYIWSLILGEEFGELCEAILESDVDNTKLESVQVAAVSNAWVETIYARGINYDKLDYLGDDVLQLFKIVGKLSKSMLENHITEAEGYATELMTSANLLRTSINRIPLQFEEINPSKHSTEIDSSLGTQHH